MLASELISRLTEMVACNGDREVCFSGDGVAVGRLTVEAGRFCLTPQAAELRPGDRVLVMDGPFCDLFAEVLDEHSGYVRARVELFGKAIVAGFGAAQLRRVSL